MTLTTDTQQFGKIPPSEYKQLFDEMIASEEPEILFEKHMRSHIHPMLCNYISRFKKQPWYKEYRDDFYNELAMELFANIRKLHYKNLDRDFDSFKYIGSILHYRSLNFIGKYVNRKRIEISIDDLYNI